MSSNILCKGKHLRIEECLIIEYGLNQNYTLILVISNVRNVDLYIIIEHLLISLNSLKILLTFHW